MTEQLPTIFALAPRGLDGAGLVIAACRAGGFGILHFSEDADSSGWMDQIRRVAKHTAMPFGICVSSRSRFAEWLPECPANLAMILGREGEGTDWADFVRDVKASNRLAFAEVSSRTSAAIAADAGVDGIVGAGHEAGGWGAESSSFILLQELLAETRVPVWIRGGIGPRVAAGCIAAGASGVVLEGGLLLARESPLGEAMREKIQRWDGGESSVFGPANGPRVRGFAPSGSAAAAALREAELSKRESWRSASRKFLGWSEDQAWPVGQDSALAQGLSRRFVTVGGIVQEFERVIARNRDLVAKLRPLGEGSPMAVSQRTRFPIVQGPMTRVSDTVAFAEAVADGGALPFLALAMLSGSEVRRLLEEANRRLSGKSWGVGILGFLPPALRKEQVEAIREARPPFALIAGGRPDQAILLESDGIPTYLHVPSPGLLKQYLKDGARRFVFEGRECGGHVGPRSSFLLWEQAAEVLEEAIDDGLNAGEIFVLFAGGIHDARSSAVVSALAAGLAERGANLGVLMGTAYLFTREAVDTGAIVPQFQQEALKCKDTVLLETGPGHEVRISPSPFATRFQEHRNALIAENRTPEQIREELEALNAGRLRIAAKGIDRLNGPGSPFVQVLETDQLDRGLYMLGQAAALRQEVISIEELHGQISGSGSTLEDASAISPGDAISKSTPSDIAIIGLSALFPQAPDARTFWENTLKGLDTITEIPPDRWDWRPYYDSDPKAPDKIISKWGGFVPDIAFDPLQYGMPPNSLSSIEPVQLLMLESVRTALEDAGYADRPFPRERTSVVLGIGGGAAQLAMGYAFRSYLPMLDAVRPGAGQEAMEALDALLPQWTEDSFPGFLLNVAAGRVANRFDLGGSNYTVDAACGSSLAAANLAVRELETGAADMVILGGADTVQNPLTYLAFSKTHAFSPRGRCRPFDDGADGIVISEGVASIVLKRLKDAERDGDRIYAVIKGVGASSDGRARGLTAPRPEGQIRALKRAYEKAGIDPKTVGYVEAHGTGTAVGDVVEIAALAEILGEAGAEPGSCAVGSVKSSIGHAKCAAGMAGLINAALALHHKVLPPTIGVETPNPRVNWANGPLHVNGSKRPWLHSDDARPRRAGVSAFGFGGTNFHAVLEAYEGNLTTKMAPSRDWPEELFFWKAENASKLIESLESLATQIDAGARPRLRDLSHSLNLKSSGQMGAGPTLAIVASSREDLRSKIDLAKAAILKQRETLVDPRGVYFAANRAPGAIAFLFPGQGCQSPGMLGDLAIAFPEVREGFEAFDSSLRDHGRAAIGPRVFPPASFSDDDRERNRVALLPPDAAQTAVGAASVGVLNLLTSLGVHADFFAGHSYGELVALHAAGCFSVESLAMLSEARGRFLLDAAGAADGAMAALSIGPERVEDLLAETPDVLAVNWNGPKQTVIAGPRASVLKAVARARSSGIRCRELPVASAFHTPMIANAREPFARLAGDRITKPPSRPVYSNLDAQPHPSDLPEIARRLGDHLASPVRFAETVEALYAQGCRVFVEVGPGGTLTTLVGSILGDRPHHAVSLDSPRQGIAGLLHALAQMAVAGVRVKLDRLTSDRDVRKLDLAKLPMSEQPPPSASAWMVNGTRARPIDAPETPRLGQANLVSKVANRNGHASRWNSFEKNHIPHKNGSIVPNENRNGREIPRPNENEEAANADQAMLAFQENMKRFLDVQRETMLQYLAGQKSAAMPSEHVTKQAMPATEVRVDFQEKSPEVPPANDPDNTPLDRDRLADRLVSLVQERTGYPLETLRLELDLEADLGVDSIKRIEILGSLREAYPTIGFGSDSSLMDELSRAKTLGAIVDRLMKNQPPREVSDKKPLPSNPGAMRRLVIEAVPAPLPSGRLGIAPQGVVVVTEDGRGIASAIAGQLKQTGHPAIVSPANMDWTSPSAVEHLVEDARQLGLVAGIVHALPLRNFPSSAIDVSMWRDRLGDELKGLFHLARAAGADLERSASLGGSVLLAATAMGGSFASIHPPEEFSATHGAIAGMAKTLAREWPEVRVRVVDFPYGSTRSFLASKLIDELFANDSHPEVGYADEHRIVLRTKAVALPRGASPKFEIMPGAPILLTGGARGITAAIAKELASRWKPRLLILGTTNPPPAEENPLTAGIAPAQLKTVLHDLLRKRNEASPASIETAYRKLLREREIRANMEAFRHLGAGVEYRQVDVRDTSSVERTVLDWRDRFGSAQGLIHGAGVIHDKLLRDKTAESFDRVLEIKVIGALNLVRVLDPSALKFTAMFSSIAGRFGNRGQADYAAANETLNKLAVWLDRRWPGRVVSLIWGPWLKVGMASDLEGHLTRQGLGMISPETGARAFVDELVFGTKGDVEVLLSGSLGDLENLPKRSRGFEVVGGLR